MNAEEKNNWERFLQDLSEDDLEILLSCNEENPQYVPVDLMSIFLQCCDSDMKRGIISKHLWQCYDYGSNDAEIDQLLASCYLKDACDYFGREAAKSTPQATLMYAQMLYIRALKEKDTIRLSLAISMGVTGYDIGDKGAYEFLQDVIDHDFAAGAKTVEELINWVHSSQH